MHVVLHKRKIIENANQHAHFYNIMTSTFTGDDVNIHWRNSVVGQAIICYVSVISKTFMLGIIQYSHFVAASTVVNCELLIRALLRFLHCMAKDPPTYS
jgi:hypothetical protein